MRAAPVRKLCFSLVELVIVVVIVSLLAAIAVPRFSSASDGADLAVLKADLRTVRDAIELYTAEHKGRTPNVKENGDLDTSGARFIKRLVQKTHLNGDRDAGGNLGPYLTEFPANRFIEKEKDQAEVRVGGTSPGQGTHGWHHDPVTGRFSADSPGHEAY